MGFHCWEIDDLIVALQVSWVGNTVEVFAANGHIEEEIGRVQPKVQYKQPPLPSGFRLGQEAPPPTVSLNAFRPKIRI